MKPLQAVAMGLVIVLLTAAVNGYDLLADPLGWLLVLLGLSSLPVPQKGALQWLAAVSLGVSVLVWFPGVRDSLNITDLALAWAAGLPQLILLIVLAHALAQAAQLASDRGPATWLRTARTLLVVVTLLPAVVLGGGFDSLDTALGLVGSAVLLLFIVLLFRYADRPWARPAPDVIRNGGHDHQDV